MERIHIYNEPPDIETLRRIARLLPNGVKDLISTRGRKYRELGLAGKELSDEEWFSWIEKEPWLLRRPIITDGAKALVGYSEKGLQEFIADIER